MGISTNSRMGILTNFISAVLLLCCCCHEHPRSHGLVFTDDYPMIREYVRNLLADGPDLRMTGEVA